jgi:hypothetical protein
MALCCLALAACAPVTYNRYQPAQTMGEGQFKLAASIDTGCDPMGELWPDVANEVGALCTDDPCSGRGVAAAANAPGGNVSFAYGAADIVDVEASLSTALYARANAKVQLLRFGGNGALALSPGGGYLPFAGHGSSDPNLDSIHRDRFSGFVGTFEAPLTVGWEVAPASIYFGAMSAYTHIQIDYHRIATDYRQNIEHRYDWILLGPIFGVQFRWKWFIITPEIVVPFKAVRFRPAYDESTFYISPGLQLGARW